MNDDSAPSYKRRCQAMIDAGIEDPDSEEGAQFCAGSSNDRVKSQCPYDHCVVFEHRSTTRAETVERKANFVKALRSHRVSVEDIALILHTSEQTIRRYLKR